MSKVSNLLKRAYRYCRYDLPEIVLPSSMPNPPHIEERLKQEREARLTLTQWREVRRGVALFAPSRCGCV